MAAASPFLHPFSSVPRYPAALIIGDSEAAIWRGQRAFDVTDRTAGTVLSAEAVERLDSARAETVWVELDGPVSEAVEALLQRIDADVLAGRYGAVVSTVPELIDPVIAAITCPDVELVINGTDVDRAAALALAERGGSMGVRDSASDATTARLRQLSEEVSRIAATLARLSASSGPSPVIGTPAPPTGDLPEISPDAVRAIIRARRLRSKFLPEDLFADPAWDMLLDLLQAEIVQHRVPVSSLCIAAAVPATTALRWLKTMTDRGLVNRRADPHDGRRIFIEMAPATSRSLRQFFAEAGLALV
ncbi:MarR family transcriptional regulator [Sphingomonas arenae]|uniref:MarR family transcriptional regulator n=1 Tax=Sphingomonas arenae TaxID=2812555 RepID=UPI001968856B|nr:MarR family transcriptional regulator [Sphingomonas arenae]